MHLPPPKLSASSVTEFKLKLKLKTYTEVCTGIIAISKLRDTMAAFRYWALARGQVGIKGVTSELVAAILDGITEWRGRSFLVRIKIPKFL